VLLLFSALYGLWQSCITGFNGDLARQRAARVLTLAEQQGTKVPLMRGHTAMGGSLLLTGNIVEALLHYDQAIALYDPVEHRPQKTLFLTDPRVTALIYRSLGLWVLGYPEAALAGTEQALSEARDPGNPASLTHAMATTCLTHLISGNYKIAKAQSDELIGLAAEKGSVYWKAAGTLRRAGLLALTEKSADAVSMFISAITAFRSNGATLYLPVWLSHLAKACAELGQLDDAWSYIGEAITAVETTKEKWCEADVHRIAGEIALMSPDRDAVKAEACFERALAIARGQQAKSWELRAAISMARLWRDQGSRDKARKLLAPVYGWFTEGCETLDLKQAKLLLDELA
jgi:predicted ATPase